MSLTLELPDELENELTAEAEKLGLTLSEYAVRILASGRMSAPRPNDGAELVSYWQKAGLVGTRPDIIDAPQHARDLRKKAERRERS